MSTPSEPRWPAAPGPTPQDSPWPGAGGPPAWPSAPDLSPQPDGSDPERRIIPAPTGPNWPLIVVGVVLVVASAALAGSLLGYPAVDLAALGPRALSIVGAVLVAAGVVGLLARRRR